MRCQNVNRKQNDNDGPVNKKIKCIKQKHVYTNFEEEDDDIASARNDELSRKELSKPKPKVDIIKNLIKRTLSSRRKILCNGATPEDLQIKYPHLKKFNYVC